MKKYLLAGGAICLLACLILGYVYIEVQNVGERVVQSTGEDAPLVIHLKHGESASHLWAKLQTNIEQEQKLLGNDLDDIYFKLWLKLHPTMTQLKAGYYEFSRDLTLEKLFQRLVDGQQTQFSIALVEGLTIKQWIASIRQVDSLKQDIPVFDDIYERLHAQRKFCENIKRSIEGCLLPDTYFYSYQDSAFSILERAHAAMDSFLDRAWGQRYQDIPLKTPYEALILASIIEKETAVAEERGLIAGVFSNRLELGMRLQTDPTVIYGIGERFDGNITRAHLREKTEYNTYRIDGLPPTPIAMSSRASLTAALQPALTDYIYFVAKGDGSHQFSITLEQHNQAVREFQLNRN